jgi:ABC-type polysaccharide/polyol phosphate transport system ATPase subunit
MSDIAIRAERLGKRYRIGQLQRYKALRDSLADAFAAPFRRLQTLGRSSSVNEELRDAMIWALKDVSFEIPAGAVVGVVGRNGAGKSTLLKVLSRITEPTEGRVEIDGRVGSLIEVGTGFHPELTGRENVYLNGAILGMRRREIDRKFDEIVAFAETERFLETPMKHYSSGMYVRLAFAVAAHLEPEVLLVDEVLAVGDAAFQQKCLGKMEAVARAGRTVIFVSHQLNQIRRLCSASLWLHEGRVRLHGPTAETVGAYESAVASGAHMRADTGRATSSTTKFLTWEVVGSEPQRANVLTTTGECRFRFALDVAKPISNGTHGIALWSNDGLLVWGWAAFNIRMPAGRHELMYRLPALPLRPGVYRWQVSLYQDGDLLDNWYCAPEMIVASQPQTHPRDEWAGILNVPCEFSIVSGAEGQHAHASGSSDG